MDASGIMPLSSTHVEHAALQHEATNHPPRPLMTYPLWVVGSFGISGIHTASPNALIRRADLVSNANRRPGREVSLLRLEYKEKAGWVRGRHST